MVKKKGISKLNGKMLMEDGAILYGMARKVSLIRGCLRLKGHEGKGHRR